MIDEDIQAQIKDIHVAVKKLPTLESDVKEVRESMIELRAACPMAHNEMKVMHSELWNKGPYGDGLVGDVGRLKERQKTVIKMSAWLWGAMVSVCGIAMAVAAWCVRIFAHK